MSPLTKTLFLASTLLPAAFSLPTILSRQADPPTSENFTIAAYSDTNPSLNVLTFGLYPFADGYLQGYLYNHGSIPLSYASAYNFGNPSAGPSGSVLEVAFNSSIQVILGPNGEITGGADGTKGFYNTPETGYLAFDGGVEGPTQNLFEACKWTGDAGTGILYTVGWLDVSSPQVGDGCEEFRLKPDV